MTAFKQIKKMLADQTDKVSGTIIADDGVLFRVSTRYGTVSAPRSDRYRVGDRVFIQKGTIVGKTNQQQTKTFEV